MSRHKKKSQQMLKRYSVENLDVRPVTSKDKWCYRPALKNGSPLKEGDWGYIITLPYAPKKHSVIEGLEGYSIIRSKKVAGQFLLQIVLTCYDNHYGISIPKIPDISMYYMKYRGCLLHLYYFFPR